MTPGPPPSPLHHAAAFIGSVAACFTAIFGAAVLASWLFDLPLVPTGVPGFDKVRANTGLGLLLAGVALGLGRRGAWPRTARALSAALLLLGVASGAQEVGGWDFGIDELLFADPAAPAGASPGRMSLTTAASLALLGLGLLLTPVRGTLAGIRAAEWCALTTALFAVFSIAGHVARQLEFAGGLFGKVPMAWTTAFAVLAAALGLLCLRPALGAAGLLLGAGMTGRMARQLFPSTLGIVVALYFGFELLRRTRAIEPGEGMVLFGISAMAALAAALWLFLRKAERLERERERAIAETTRLATELRAADAKKDEFLAILGHELRNPLAALRHAGELLAEEWQGSDATVREALAVHARQSAHLKRLVDDLLDVSRITRGTIELRRATIALHEIAASAAASVREVMAQRRHRFEIVACAEPLWVDGDAARIEQACVNLLVNAAKYTPAGGEITLRMERRDGRAALHIADNGAGMEPEEMARAFEMFGRLDRTTHEIDGLGIGLTLAHRLAVLHGGALEGRSDGEGKGCTFSLWLPLAAGGASLRDAAASDGPASRSDAPRRDILIVDDNADAANALARLLGRRGHAVRVAYDGEAGLAVAAARLPEVCLLDLGLPGRNGFDLARALRALPGGAALRLVAISGYAQAADRARSRAAGFDHHLAKPVELDELAALL